MPRLADADGGTELIGNQQRNDVTLYAGEVSVSGESFWEQFELVGETQVCYPAAWGIISAHMSCCQASVRICVGPF